MRGADKRIGVVTWSPLYCSTRMQHRANWNARRISAHGRSDSVYGALHCEINTQPLLSGNMFDCLFNAHN